MAVCSGMRMSQALVHYKNMPLSLAFPEPPCTKNFFSVMPWSSFGARSVRNTLWEAGNWGSMTGKRYAGCESEAHLVFSGRGTNTLSKASDPGLFPGEGAAPAPGRSRARCSQRMSHLSTDSQKPQSWRLERQCSEWVGHLP